MDLNYVASIFANDNPLRLRVGTVVSVQTDRTCTVTVGGDTTQISGIKYMSDIAPDPQSAIWLVSDGRDLFALGHLSAANRTLATKATRSTAQSLTSGTDTAISFDAATYNDWGAWVVGSATRLTAPVTGRYMVIGNATFAGNATNTRRIWLRVNGAGSLAGARSHSNLAGQPTDLSVSSVTTMSIGDYVELICLQNSGGALDVNAGVELSLVYLGS